MKKTVKIETDLFGNNYLDLNEILIGTNINPKTVKYYELVEKDDNLVLTLYDKKKQQIKVNYE